ncbi:MAG: hypothetical protein NTZ68_00220 [Candidatus Dependentiae bacterium]|nr:hypothetical protein [Candidatus Dependentiae bacterium]
MKKFFSAFVFCALIFTLKLDCSGTLGKQLDIGKISRETLDDLFPHLTPDRLEESTSGFGRLTSDGLEESLSFSSMQRGQRDTPQSSLEDSCLSASSQSGKNKKTLEEILKRALARLPSFNKPEDKPIGSFLKTCGRIHAENNGTIPDYLLPTVDGFYKFFVTEINTQLPDSDQFRHVFQVNSSVKKTDGSKSVLILDGGHSADTCRKLDDYGLIWIRKSFWHEGFHYCVFHNSATWDPQEKTEFPKDWTKKRIEEFLRKHLFAQDTKWFDLGNGKYQYALIAVNQYVSIRIVKNTQSRGPNPFVTAYPVFDLNFIREQEKNAIKDSNINSGAAPAAVSASVLAELTLGELAAKPALTASDVQDEIEFSVVSAASEAPAASEANQNETNSAVQPPAAKTTRETGDRLAQLPLIRLVLPANRGRLGLASRAPAANTTGETGDLPDQLTHRELPANRGRKGPGW